eukprot:2048356-Prorocentrum_lima.AAC.1
MDDDKQLKKCGQRRHNSLEKQKSRVSPEDVSRYQNLNSIMVTLTHNPAIAQASDWASALGGAHT